MGCGASAPELVEQQAQNKAIQNELNEARKEAQKETKLLLLGVCVCGRVAPLCSSAFAFVADREWRRAL